MKLLMTDEKLRKSMSANAIESSKQFFHRNYHKRNGWK